MGSEWNAATWLKDRAVQWMEKGLVGPRHVRRILAAEGESAVFSLPRRFGSRSLAMAIAGLLLLAAGLWHSLFTGPSLLAWGPRLAIALLVMVAANGLALSGWQKRLHPAAQEVILAAGVVAFGFGVAALAEGIGLSAPTALALLLAGLGSLLLAWVTNSRLLLVLSTVSLTGWMLQVGLYQHRLNLWFPLLLLAGLPLTLRISCWINLLLVAVTFPAWLGLAAKPSFSPVELFLPFTLVLWGGLWVVVGQLEGGRGSRLADAWKWIGCTFLLGSLGFLSLHALGVSQAQAVLANPGWQLKGGLPLLIVNGIVTLGIIIGLITGFRRGRVNPAVAVGVVIATLAVWVYLVFPERIPRELAGSLLTDYFLLTPFAFGMITLLALAGAVWLGYRSGDGFVFYLALAGVVIFAGVRYFDLIWPSQPKPFFLYLNGIVLALFWYLADRSANKAEAEKSR